MQQRINIITLSSVYLLNVAYLSLRIHAPNLEIGSTARDPSFSDAAIRHLQTHLLLIAASHSLLFKLSALQRPFALQLCHTGPICQAALCQSRFHQERLVTFYVI